MTRIILSKKKATVLSKKDAGKVKKVKAASTKSGLRERGVKGKKRQICPLPRCVRWNNHRGDHVDKTGKAFA